MWDAASQFSRKPGHILYCIYFPVIYPSLVTKNCIHTSYMSPLTKYHHTIPPPPQSIIRGSVSKTAYTPFQMAGTASHYSDTVLNVQSIMLEIINEDWWKWLLEQQGKCRTAALSLRVNIQPIRHRNMSRGCVVLATERVAQTSLFRCQVACLEENPAKLSFLR
jgi:hypothetical protein